MTNSTVNSLLAGNARPRLVTLNEQSQLLGVSLFVFAERNIDLQKRKIAGLVYNPDVKKWVQRVFLFPDILYTRRGPGKKGSKADKFVQAIAQIGIPQINSCSDFDKWDTYSRFRRYPELVSHLPETCLLTTVDQLKDMFARYQSLYIKGTIGRHGRKVIRVDRRHRQYIASHLGKRLRVWRFSSIRGLLHKVRAVLNSKRLLAQQAVGCIQLAGGNVDFRAEVQRDGNGELGVTCIAGRVATPGAPVSSSRTGSTVFTFADTLRRCSYSDTQIRSLEQAAETFLCNIFQCVEQEYGSFGELGIDFIIDTDDKFWLLEVNAKSAMGAAGQAWDAETIALLYRRPLEYARYLFESNSQP